MPGRRAASQRERAKGFPFRLSGYRVGVRGDTARVAAARSSKGRFNGSAIASAPSPSVDVDRRSAGGRSARRLPHGRELRPHARSLVRAAGLRRPATRRRRARSVRGHAARHAHLHRARGDDPSLPRRDRQLTVGRLQLRGQLLQPGERLDLAGQRHELVPRPLPRHHVSDKPRDQHRFQRSGPHAGRGRPRLQHGDRPRQRRALLVGRRWEDLGPGNCRLSRRRPSVARRREAESGLPRDRHRRGKWERASGVRLERRREHV